MTARALVATTALAAAGAAAFYLYGGQDDDDDVSEMPQVSRDECVAIFEKITAIMTQQINTLMRKIQAQGAQIPQQMLQSYLVEHFETQLKEVQSVVFKEYGYDVEDVEQAFSYYEAVATRDEGVCDACNALRQLYTNVGGRVDLDLPEDLTVEKMCEVFEESVAPRPMPSNAAAAPSQSGKYSPVHSAQIHVGRARGPGGLLPAPGAAEGAGGASHDATAERDAPAPHAAAGDRRAEEARPHQPAVGGRAREVHGPPGLQGQGRGREGRRRDRGGALGALKILL